MDQITEGKIIQKRKKYNKKKRGKHLKSCHVITKIVCS